MKEKIKFHLDENVSQAIALGLRRRGVDVTTTPEEGLLGLSDERQLQFALSQGRAIFTQDTDFLRMNTLGMSHAGIVYCPQQSKSIGAIIQGLLLIWEILEPQEMFNHIEFL
jgi:predicted nuclease of predicted toxin-antitoxin system